MVGQSLKTWCEGKKLTVLVFVAHYLPGYKFGGPLRSISNMIDSLGDEFDFKVITLDRDFLENRPYQNIVANEWNIVGKAKVLYCQPSMNSLLSLRRLLSRTDYDVLYLNSFFDPVFTIKALLLRRMRMIPVRPVVLAPRGEFSPGALRLKAYKKKPHLLCAKALGLYNDLVWHASTHYEAVDIKAALGKIASRIHIAVDLPTRSETSNEPQWPDKSPDCLRIVFLSRISPMKNLDYALAVFDKVGISVKYDIYGTVEDRNYWELCRKIIKRLPGNISVEYKGELPHAKVHDVLRDHDLFYLPTRGENYGHVIHEALSAGLPILISDETPWRNLADKRIGWDLPLADPMAFASKIEAVAAMDAAEHHGMRKNAWEYGQQVDNNDEALNANRQLFVSAISGK